MCSVYFRAAGGEIPSPKFSVSPPKMLRHTLNYTLNKNFYPPNLLVHSQYCYPRINTVSVGNYPTIYSTDSTLSVLILYCGAYGWVKYF